MKKIGENIPTLGHLINTGEAVLLVVLLGSLLCRRENIPSIQKIYLQLAMAVIPLTIVLHSYITSLYIDGAIITVLLIGLIFTATILFFNWIGSSLKMEE